MRGYNRVDKGSATKVSGSNGHYEPFLNIYFFTLAFPIFALTIVNITAALGSVFDRIMFSVNTWYYYYMVVAIVSFLIFAVTLYSWFCPRHVNEKNLPVPIYQSSSYFPYIALATLFFFTSLLFSLYISYFWKTYDSYLYFIGEGCRQDPGDFTSTAESVTCGRFANFLLMNLVMSCMTLGSFLWVCGEEMNPKVTPTYYLEVVKGVGDGNVDPSIKTFFQNYLFPAGVKID